MTKIQILTTCQHCNGEAYIKIGEAECYTEEPHVLYEPCSKCQGSGTQTRWISLRELAELIQRETRMEPRLQSACPDHALPPLRRY